MSIFKKSSLFTKVCDVVALDAAVALDAVELVTACVVIPAPGLRRGQAPAGIQGLKILVSASTLDSGFRRNDRSNLEFGALIFVISERRAFGSTFTGQT